MDDVITYFSELINHKCGWWCCTLSKFRWRPIGSTDIPGNTATESCAMVTGDWTGSGTTKIGLVRFNNTWLLDASGNGLWSLGDYQYIYGKAGDRNVSGKWS